MNLSALSAYQEASRTVIAYQLGWWVSQVRLACQEDNGESHSTMHYAFSYYTTDRQVIVYCAGCLAAWKYNPKGQQYCDETELKSYLEAIHNGRIDKLGNEPSLSLLALKKEHPAWTDDQIIEAFKQHEHTCWKLLDTPGVWADIERLAAALLAKGSLLRDEVEKIIKSVSFSSVVINSESNPSVGLLHP